MNKFLSDVKRFLKSEDGPTTAEYAVMLALMIVVSMVAITGIGQTVSGIFTTASSGLPTGGGS